MLQFTSREFRSNQASILNLADTGEQVVIRRRGKQSYMLIPIDDDDFTLTPALKKRISTARKLHEQGKLRKFNNEADLQSWLDNL